MTTGEGSESCSDHSEAAAGPTALAELMSTFARDVSMQDSPYTTLVEVVRAAVELVPGCDEASITLVQSRGTVSWVAPSGDLPRLVDALQAKHGEGPCLDAVLLHVTVRVPDMAAESRWPRFAPAAAGAGAAGMMCLQLWVEGDNFGALNLYSKNSGDFTDESEEVGLALAAHAAVAYSSALERSTLLRRLSTQQIIGQAQGILIERHKLSDAAAFAALVRASQHSNVKLRELAERLVRTGELHDPITEPPPSNRTP